MTTQPKTKCDDAVFNKGTLVAQIHGVPSTFIEALVVRCREEKKVRIDWHYAGGIGRVLVLGSKKDLEAARHYFSHTRLVVQVMGDDGAPVRAAEF